MSSIAPSDSDRIADLENRVKQLEDMLNSALAMAKSHPMGKMIMGMLGK